MRFWFFVPTMAAMLISFQAHALDWSQPVLDENNKPSIDWLSCPGKDPSKGDKCSAVLTVGMYTARALFSPQTGPSGDGPEVKSLMGNLGLAILADPKMTPTPEQLKMAKDAVGKTPFPLAIARVNAILDKAVK
jgi:hypothetical protein